MILSHIGEFTALLTAICWAIAVLIFEAVGKRIGSLCANFFQLTIGFILLSLFTFFTRGKLLPVDASLHNWIWLSLSGFFGFFIGDILLFRAFILIGSRISMLIYSLVPPLTAILAWIFLKEALTLQGVLGMMITIFGISLVVLKRDTREKQFKFSHSVSGILLALGGAAGQAIGLVLSKYGMEDYNVFAATQIRSIPAIISISILFCIIRRQWPKVMEAVKQKKLMLNTTIGTFFGFFLGVTLSLIAIRYTNTGIASTIMSIVPVLIIPPAVILFKEKVNIKEIAGAVIAVTGVAFLFL